MVELYIAGAFKKDRNSSVLVRIENQRLLLFWGRLVFSFLAISDVPIEAPISSWPPHAGAT